MLAHLKTQVMSLEPDLILLYLGRIDLIPQANENFLPDYKPQLFSVGLVCMDERSIRTKT